jgi:hypothetical protein
MGGVLNLRYLYPSVFGHSCHATKLLPLSYIAHLKYLSSHREGEQSHDGMDVRCRSDYIEPITKSQFASQLVWPPALSCVTVT